MMRRASILLRNSPQFLDGSAYVNHIELVRKARGAEMPKSFWDNPLMYQGCSQFLGPNDPIIVNSEDYGIDFEAEVGIVLKDTPMSVSIGDAGQYIDAVVLINDISLRNLVADELSKGFGFVQSKPQSALSPYAVNTVTFGKYWEDFKVHLPLKVYLNDKLFGEPNAGVDMTFSFAQLIVHAAKTRPLTAGTIIGSGTVSNYDKSKGSCCIIEKRMIETLETGQPVTPFLKFGDKVRIEMLDEYGNNIFGSIEQKVVQYDIPNT